jgi:hypothetical protein
MRAVDTGSGKPANSIGTPGGRVLGVSPHWSLVPKTLTTATVTLTGERLTTTASALAGYLRSAADALAPRDALPD